jgi:hypothetical protein
VTDTAAGEPRRAIDGPHPHAHGRTHWLLTDDAGAEIGWYADPAKAVAALNRLEPGERGGAAVVAFDARGDRLPGAIHRHAGAG